MAEDRIVRTPEMRRRLGVSKSTLERREKLGRIPARVRDTGNRPIGWRASEIKKAFGFKDL